MTIQQIRKLFVAPDGTNKMQYAKLAALVAKSLAEIYSGEFDTKVDFGLVNGNIKDVLNQVLNRESRTRRFNEKFMGQIHPQGNIVGILSSFIAAHMNTNTIVKEVSQSEHHMEHEVLDWLAHEMFHYDRNKYSGNVVSGGTMANFTALAVAKEKMARNPNGTRRSLFGRRFVVLGTEFCHYSVTKACHVLGTDSIEFEQVKSKNFRTDCDDLEKAIMRIKKLGEVEILAIIGLAGETETGTIDDLDKLADIAEKYQIYLHVDAAYGGPFILSRIGKRFSGINRADSIAVDPHKLLYTPYPAGVILFKNKFDHVLIQQTARYLENGLQDGVLGRRSQRNFGFAGRLEGSMGASGVISTWATIKLLGKDGMSTLLNHTLDLTNHAYELVNQSKYLRAVLEPEINTLLIGLKPEVLDIVGEGASDLLDLARHRLEKDYGYYVSFNADVDRGQAALRMVPMHPYSKDTDVESLINLLEKEIINLLSSERHLRHKTGREPRILAVEESGVLQRESLSGQAK